MTIKQKLLCWAERVAPRAPKPPTPTARRYVLWSITHLGDVVLQLPAATALKRARPQADVAMVVKTPFRSLVELCPDVDQIFCYDPRWSTRPDQARSGLRQTAHLRRQLARFDVAFIFDFHPLSRLLLRWARIPALVGYGSSSSCLSLPLSHPPPDRHRLEEGLALLAAAGLPLAEAEFQLQLPASVQARAQEQLRQEGWQGEPFLALCPGSGNPQKCWPLERFAAVANWLTQNALRALLLGSTYDQHRAQAVAARLRVPPLNLVGRTDVCQLAALLALSELVLTNDSGAMHLAAALGRPLLALFGPTDPARWGPRGPGPSRVLRASTGHMQDLSVETVVGTIEKHFPSLPERCPRPIV
ncbi:MAG: glycosyltransferase family 9 protein [Acidobacteriota bacterium]